jgi:hypothetical protein
MNGGSAPRLQSAPFGALSPSLGRFNLRAMKAKRTMLVAAIVILGILVFGAGVVVGVWRGHKQAQKTETRFVLPVSYRTYKALESGDTERAKYLCGGLLSTYTEQYDSLFPTGVESARFESLLTDARQISQTVRSNILRTAFATNAMR